MTAPTTGPTPTPPGGNPSAPAAQQPAPAPAAPANNTPATNPTGAAPAVQPAAPAAGQVGQPPADGAKTFTQADLDRIINERLAKQQASFEKSMGEKLAGIFGPQPADGSTPSGEDALAKAMQVIEQAQTRANTATARSFAATGIRDDRVDTLVGMVDLKTALANVDANDPAAVNAAIKAAVDAEAAKYPEWKRDAAPTLPGSSTANPNTPQGNGKRVYTRDELSKMSQRELAAIADDLIAAGREGRIK